MSRMRKNPDSVRGKRLPEEKKVKLYGRVLNALFLPGSCLRPNRITVLFRRSVMEGK